MLAFGLGLVSAGELEDESPRGDRSDREIEVSDTIDRVVQRSELEELEGDLAEALALIGQRTTDPIELRDQLVEFERLNHNAVRRAESLRRELHTPPPANTRLPAPAEVSGESTLGELEAVIHQRITALREQEGEPVRLRDQLAAFLADNQELMEWHRSARERARASAPRSRPVLGDGLPGETDERREAREILSDLAAGIGTLRERTSDPSELRDLLVEFERLNTDLLDRLATLHARIVEGEAGREEPTETTREGE